MEAAIEAVGERVKETVSGTNDLGVVLVLRALLTTCMNSWNILRMVNGDILIRSKKNEIRKRIIHSNIRLQSKHIPRIIAELLRKDLIFDPKKYDDRYCLKLVDSPDHVGSFGNMKDVDANLVDLCNEKIDKLIPAMPADKFIPINESGDRDRKQIALELTDEHLDDNFINFRIYDYSKLRSISDIKLAISKDDFAPKEKHEFHHYEGDEPELVDQKPFGIYERKEWYIEGYTYFNLPTHGDGTYRITIMADSSNEVFFSIFIFNIKDRKISSIKENINSAYFTWHRYAHHHPKKDINLNKHQVDDREILVNVK